MQIKYIIFGILATHVAALAGSSIGNPIQAPIHAEGGVGRKTCGDYPNFWWNGIDVTECQSDQDCYIWGTNRLTGNFDLENEPEISDPVWSVIAGPGHQNVQLGKAYPGIPLKPGNNQTIRVALAATTPVWGSLRVELELRDGEGGVRRACVGFDAYVQPPRDNDI